MLPAGRRDQEVEDGKAASLLAVGEPIFCDPKRSDGEGKIGGTAVLTDANPQASCFGDADFAQLPR